MVIIVNLQMKFSQFTFKLCRHACVSLVSSCMERFVRICSRISSDKHFACCLSDPDSLLILLTLHNLPASQWDSAKQVSSAGNYRTS